MQKSLIAVTVFCLFACVFVVRAQTENQLRAIPLPPNTGENIAAATSSPPVPEPIVPAAPDYPERLAIPAIALSDQIVQVGVTQGGDMAVPAGTTKDVGWYEYGTVPGDTGNAVIDAHVFAAFSKLAKLKTGNDIFVQTTAGKTLHFVVTDVETYPLASVPVDALFGRTDGSHLNLITCAGNLTSDRSTYDHRLIVYTTLVND
jgi:LPXTG-site transpeptidase (sortase) family protein